MFQFHEHFLKQKARFAPFRSSFYTAQVTEHLLNDILRDKWYLSQ